MKTYEATKMEILQFENVDILTVSCDDELGDVDFWFDLIIPKKSKLIDE